MNWRRIQLGCVLSAIVAFEAVAHGQGHSQPPSPGGSSCPPTVRIGTCETGVVARLNDGSCLQNLVDACLRTSVFCHGPGEVVKCVTNLKHLLSGKDLKAIVRCAAQVKEPKCLGINEGVGPAGRYACVGARAECPGSSDLAKVAAKDAWTVVCDKLCKDKECDPKTKKCKRKTNAVGTVDFSVDDDNECVPLDANKPKGCYIQATGVCQCKCE